MPHTRPVRIWDIALSVVLVIALLVVTATTLMFAIFLPMATDGCSSACNMTQIEVGFILSLALPILFALAAIVVTVVFLVKRRLAFWVPLAGIGGVIVGLLIGAALVMTAIPNFF